MVVVLQHKKHSKLHTAKRLTKISDLLTVQLKKKPPKEKKAHFISGVQSMALN